MNETPKTPEFNRAYPWICVALLWVVWLLNYLDRQVIFSVFPLIQRELQLSPLELGLLGTSFLWVYAAASPFAGYLADRFGRKRLIVLSLVIWSVVTWMTGHARNLTQLLTARALMGLSEACYLPAGLALIAAWHGERTRAKATGIHYSGNYLGMVLGGALGGWMGEQYGWRAAFSILGVIGIVYSAVLFFGLRDRSEPSISSKSVNSRGLIQSARELFALPGYTTMFAVFAILSIGNWVTYTWLPLYLYERFGMSLAEAGFSATFYLQIGSFAGILLGGTVADRWVAREGRARVFTQAAGLFAAAPFLFLSGFTSSTALLLAGMVVFGIGRGIYDANCMPALCQIAPADLRATGYGWFNFIGPFAGGITAAAAGALKSSIGIGGTLQAAGLLLVLAAVLLARVRIPAPMKSQTCLING